MNYEDALHALAMQWSRTLCESVLPVSSEMRDGLITKFAWWPQQEALRTSGVDCYNADRENMCQPLSKADVLEDPHGRH